MYSVSRKMDPKHRVNQIIYGVAILSIVTFANAQDSGSLIGTINGALTIIPNPNYADANLTVPQFITKYEYPVEVHYVTTEDGYILALHRIPYGLQSPASNVPKPVAYLQHGLLASSASWTINGPSSSLGFMLADEGYDVWLGNFRGNTYSRNHTTLNPNDTSGDFWEFSFHENGEFDVPATINYILSTTGQAKLTYVGHSMGTTSFFIAMSLDSSLNAKVNLFIALAPVVYLTYTATPIRIIAPLLIGGVTGDLLTALGPGEFDPNNAYMNQFKSWTCVTNLTADLVCDSTFFLFMGFDFPQLNNSQLPVYNSNYPQGSSLKTFIHYGQYINTPSFCQYDYGLLANIFTYGSLTPPVYDLTKTTVPTALISGHNDWLADPTDVQNLIELNKLPNVILKKQIAYTGWNHADFIWAIDINDLLNDDLITLINQYNGV